MHAFPIFRQQSVGVKASSVPFSEGEPQTCLLQRGTCGLDTHPGLMVHQVTLSKSLSSSCSPAAAPVFGEERRVAPWRALSVVKVPVTL